MRTSALLALAGTAALLCVVPPVGAVVAPCDGQRPTIVSSARVVEGTPGPDVIVVRARRAYVDAGRGHDTICVRTGRAGLGAYVVPGPGNDRVLVETHTRVIASLDEGRDTYLGGPGVDSVWTGVRGRVNRDRILLGAGDDSVGVDRGTAHRGVTIDGGGGRDELKLSSQGGSLSVDAASRRATHRGRPFVRWQGMERYVLSTSGPSSFTGSEGDDAVRMEGGSPQTLRTLGGDDEVTLGIDVHAPPLLLDLGDGTDTLHVSGRARTLTADLSTQRLDLSDGSQQASYAFSGVEGLVVQLPHWVDPGADTRVELIGSDAGDVLRASACHVVLRGRGGDDHLRVGVDTEELDPLLRPFPLTRECVRTSEVYGESGDDVLESRGREHVYRITMDGPFGTVETLGTRKTVVADRLDGGDGDDSAGGGTGVDTCVAERVSGCES
ncbi:hypothetical protein [Nocardioides terrigena]|uniref:hypothetical protein n=1 Tax=Nocardioides terrigena TaxID=424797 RepID=UPI000D31D351|nr:hypothetical protein [Nocardioides terrigena]